MALSLSIGLLGSIAATEPSAAAAPGFEQVYATDARVICHLPRSGNAQRVVGFDSGNSFVYEQPDGTKAAYWSIGDSYIDGNGDGMYHGPDEPFGFRTGTIARATDLTAEDCVGDVTLRTTNGRTVLGVFPPDASIGECLMWPNVPFEADGKLWFFYGTVGYPNCNPNLPATSSGVSLGRIGLPNAPTLGPVRVGQGYTYRGAVKANNRIYLYRIEADNLYLARVNEKHVANRDRYEYWDGDFFTSDEAAAVPFSTGWRGADIPIVEYNAYLDRYLAVYSCSIDELFDALCARTSKSRGDEQAALFSGWNEPTVIYRCAFYTCGYGAWHPGYSDPAHPERIYVSTAHWPAYREYFPVLRSIELADSPPDASHIYAEAEDDFFDWQVAHHWYSFAYSYDPTLERLDMTPLGDPLGYAPPDAAGRRGPAAVGTESVGGYPAPGVAANALFPSETSGAARVFTASVAGTASVSGEAWIESTSGDGVVAEVLVVRADGAVETLWQKPLVPAWQKARGKRLVNLTGIELDAGDRILVGARKGRSPLKNATADFTYFPVSLSFDAA